MKKSLKEFTDSELEGELAKRKLERPTPLKDIDWSPISNYLEGEGVSRLEEDGFLDEDFKQYLFETVLEVVYGKNIWAWWNSRVNK